MLEIQNLKAGYGGKPVVEIAAMSLAAGEHCLILGASGSGKTTLLYALAGLLKPLAGSAKIGEQDITGLNKAALDKFRGNNIGIIYQTLHMVDALTVMQNLLLAQYAAGNTQDTTKAEKLLAHLDVQDFKNRKPEALSQGQKQRVAIARALIKKPALVLADEPTGSLDRKRGRSMIELLQKVCSERQAALITVTHDLDAVKAFPESMDFAVINRAFSGEENS